MKVLLDGDLPHKLRLVIRDHEVSTVGFIGWSGLKNGALLRAIEQAGFEVFLTGDKTMPSQQTVGGRSFAVVVLSTLDWEMKPHVDRIASAIDGAEPGVLQIVECGEFQR